MNYITNLLFWISNGLLVPVILLLISFFIISLFQLGIFYDLYIKRRKFRKSMKKLWPETNPDFRDISFTDSIKGNSYFTESLLLMKKYDYNETDCSRILSDYELSTDKKMNISRFLMRLGPMLGLMGTLIPMGPALTGLAAGDINSMALNMQVAFSTTVTGIFTGGVGYLLTVLKERWKKEDLCAMEYIFDKISGNMKNNEKTELQQN